MERRHKSFPERTYKANIMSGGLTYKISPMTMIIDQIRRDSMEAGVVINEGHPVDEDEKG